MRKLVSVLASGALVMGSMALAGPSIAATPAITSALTAPATISVASAKKQAKAPKIVNGKSKTTKTAAPHISVQTVKLPVLQNSTSRNRKNFAKYANELVKAELKNFNSIRTEYCGTTATATFDISPSRANIYKGRYASVTMGSGQYFCGATASSSVRSFTLDLKTGKKVGIGTFVAQDDITTKVAVASNFFTAKNRCISDLIPVARKNESGYIPRPLAWDVSSKGIRFHYEKYALGAGACGNPSVLLPWAEVSPAKSMKGSIKNRTYVNGIKYDAASKLYFGEIIITSVQGRKITVFESALNGDGGCLHGVRNGKTGTLSTNWGGFGKVKFKLKDTSASPKFNTSSFGKGWSEANAKDLRAIKASAGATLTARKVCGA